MVLVFDKKTPENAFNSTTSKRVVGGGCGNIQLSPDISHDKLGGNRCGAGLTLLCLFRNETFHYEKLFPHLKNINIGRTRLMSD